MNISDEEYEELESYFQLKLRDKEEQLRYALQMRCEAEEKAFFAVSKVDEIRGNCKLENRENVARESRTRVYDYRRYRPREVEGSVDKV